MKKGFTMIELIFVIVILGILAAVAVPKLNATRADAERAKGATNIATLMTDLASYATAQGGFMEETATAGTYTFPGWAKITNVTFASGATASGDTTTAPTATLQIENKDCLVFTLPLGVDPKVQIKTAAATPAGTCKTVIETPSVQAMLTNSNGDAVTTNTDVEFDFAAQGIKW